MWRHKFIISSSFLKPGFTNLLSTPKHIYMERKTFLKNTALCAIAVSASGFIRFDGERYTGDCATTSDILGPFYRPGSPVRSDLAMTGSTGTPLQLTGKVLHENCSDPFSNARVELWHCDEKACMTMLRPGLIIAEQPLQMRKEITFLKPFSRFPTRLEMAFPVLPTST